MQAEITAHKDGDNLVLVIPYHEPHKDGYSRKRGEDKAIALKLAPDEARELISMIGGLL